MPEPSRKLGLSNRAPAILDALVKRLRDDPDDALGRRLVARYIKLDGSSSVEKLQTWLEDNREFLFFSDVGGYRWFVDENARKAKKLPVAAGASSGS